MKKRNLKERITLDPIMTLLVLIVLTIVISGFLSLLGVQVTYNTITDSVTFNYYLNWYWGNGEKWIFKNSYYSFN